MIDYAKQFAAADISMKNDRTTVYGEGVTCKGAEKSKEEASVQAA